MVTGTVDGRIVALLQSNLDTLSVFVKCNLLKIELLACPGIS